MKSISPRGVSPFLISIGSIVVLVAGVVGAYSYGLHRNDGKINDLNSEISAANAKIASLTPSTEGLFNRATAVVGEKSANGNWKVSSVDKATGDVVLTSTAVSAIVTGLFFNSTESGRPCLLYEQMGLESGSLPAVVGQPNASLCASETTNSSIIAKFGSVKSYSWASVEIGSLTYTDHGTFAEINKVRTITPLLDSGE